MKIEKIIFFYFSGTGNSCNIVRWFSERALENGTEAVAYDISKIDDDFPQIKESDLIVFISPIHGFNYPPIMSSFISRFPKGKNKILLLNTRAGMLIRKWVTPGLTGIAFYLSALKLAFKGYSIIGMKAFDMPSNWIFLHPGLNDRTVLFIHEKIKSRVIALTDRIIAGKKDFGAIKEILQDLLIAPIAFLYYFIGRFILSKTYFASSDCNNCGICIKNCPLKAIITKSNMPFWTLKCESCMRCLANCPSKSIETAHGFFAFTLLISYAVSGAFSRLLAHNTTIFTSETVQFFFESSVCLLMFIANYRILHYFLKYKTFNKAIAYFSLTKYKFWGKRYKALKNIYNY